MQFNSGSISFTLQLPIFYTESVWRNNLELLSCEIPDFVDF